MNIHRLKPVPPFTTVALIAAALFAVVWATIRACVQSVTIDEADTYFWFVTRAPKELFHPFPNNHILNSLLMWASIHVFGTSVFSIRAPALLGGAIYVAICYFLSRSIADRFNLQLSIFICLVYNPFILDFMSVGRGYSLANAFLLAAIAAPVWHYRMGGSVRMGSAVASLALGLSFIAVFSYAFVDIAVFVAIVTWAVRNRGGALDWRPCWLHFPRTPGCASDWRVPDCSLAEGRALLWRAFAGRDDAEPDRCFAIPASTGGH